MGARTDGDGHAVKLIPPVYVKPFGMTWQFAKYPNPARRPRRMAMESMAAGTLPRR
jgi:hypothetical protein